MKSCNDCNAVYENTMNYCPQCGAQLTSAAENSNSRSSIYRDSVYVSMQNGPRINAPTGNEYVFERTEGLTSVFNGAVSEVSTQQTYQSKLTKTVKAFFAGEPYQWGHTTEISVIRIEEHTNNGYPEKAQDLRLYGSLRGVLAVGDDVTVRAKRIGDLCVVKQIINHTTSSTVKIQGNIPASVIRIAVLLAAMLLISLIKMITSINFAALIAGLFSSLLPVIVIIAIVWYIFRRFKRKA